MFALRWLFSHHFWRKGTTKNAHTQAFGQKNDFFSTIQPNSGLITAINKAGGLDRPSASKPLLTPLKGEG